MNSVGIDKLNIGLIFISLLAAVVIPFELFIFSYAFLGPLHYLTEINWLNGKNFFLKKNKNWIVVLIVLALLATLYPIVHFIDKETALYLFNKFPFPSYKIVLLTSFLFVISLFIVKKGWHIFLALIAISLFSFIAIRHLPLEALYLVLFIPNLIHVYVFTLLFILYGASKSKSRYGYYVGLILILVPILISIVPFDLVSYTPSIGAVDVIIESRFSFINEMLSYFLTGSERTPFEELSPIVIRIQIFIAFAYTYHYLNWFSKTSIIKWGEGISKWKLAWICILWIFSVGLYLYDFQLGLIALLFLSTLHVYLEFPLNMLTIKELLRPTESKN